jgi:hypothetical protein
VRSRHHSDLRPPHRSPALLGWTARGLVEWQHDLCRAWSLDVRFEARGRPQERGPARREVSKGGLRAAALRAVLWQGRQQLWWRQAVEEVVWGSNCQRYEIPVFFLLVVLCLMFFLLLPLLFRQVRVIPSALCLVLDTLALERT